MPLFLFLFLSLLASCQTQPKNPLHTTEIWGRSDTATLSTREPIYRIQIPEGWTVIIPPLESSLTDTTEPLMTLINHDVKVTFHNFPVAKMDQRIPPQAQITRWKKQFDQLEETSVLLVPFATGGFTGIQFEATGVQKGTLISVKAWTMQLTPELFQKLPEKSLQEKSDWTLKAVGPSEQLELLQEDLQLMARSIELIREVPSR